VNPWYQCQNYALYERKLGTMLPRRHKERLVVNAAMGEEMRQICVRLDAMETT
jgi:hypothetical protein